jgi:hypothetical protein
VVGTVTIGTRSLDNLGSVILSGGSNITWWSWILPPSLNNVAMPLVVSWVLPPPTLTQDVRPYVCGQ